MRRCNITPSFALPALPGTLHLRKAAGCPPPPLHAPDDVSLVAAKGRWLTALRASGRVT